MGGIIVKPRSRILHGHDWVYAGEIQKTFGEPADGDVISIKDGRDHFLGMGLFNSRSQITVRRFSRQRQDLDRDFFERRITQAIDYRTHSGCRADLSRLVWSESDGLPGVVVDRYGPIAVLQTLTLGMDRHKAVIAEILMTHIEGLSGVVERNDAPVRANEGLPLLKGLLAGEVPPSIEIEAAGVLFSVSPLESHKTGLYLDQIESYAVVAPLAQGRSVLDCFSNQGGFALACAKAGATAVTAVESGTESVERLRVNAARNAVTVNARQADVFDFLKRPDQPAYDLIILDPPSFTKSRGRVGEALRGYRDLHARAARLLSKDGLLATFSCSHHVTSAEFEQAIAEGLVDAKRNMRLIRRLGQPADHPVVMGLPETEYLKGVLLQAMPGR